MNREKKPERGRRRRITRERRKRKSRSQQDEEENGEEQNTGVIGNGTRQEVEEPETEWNWWKEGQRREKSKKHSLCSRGQLYIQDGCNRTDFQVCQVSFALKCKRRSSPINPTMPSKVEPRRLQKNDTCAESASVKSIRGLVILKSVEILKRRWPFKRRRDLLFGCFIGARASCTAECAYGLAMYV